MRRLTVLAAVALALAACSGTGTARPVESMGTTGTGGPADTTAAPAAGVDEELPLVMAAALEELVTLHHTGRDGPPPFAEYVIQSHTDLDAGTDDGERRLLTIAERQAIETAIRPFGFVRWIDDPADWRTDDLRPTIAGSAILGAARSEHVQGCQLTR